ncbi:hypothetical protein Tco_0462149 [Tanacetum coccineum]
MEKPDTMINDVIKQSSGYKSGKGKGYMCLGNHEVNVPNAFKKNVVPRKQRSITIVDNLVPREDVAVELAKLISPAIEDPVVQSLLDLQRGSKESRLESMRQEKQAVGGEESSATHNKYNDFEDVSATDSNATQDSSCSDTDEAKDDATNDFDNFDMDLSDDEPKGDDDGAGFGVFMYNNSTELLKSIYLSPIEMFLDDTTHHISSPLATTIHNPAVAQKFKEYDQKLKALLSIKVSEAIKKVVQAKVLTEMKKQLPTYVLNSIAKYVKPYLNNFVCEVMRNNHITLFTIPSPTTIDDLSEMDLKLKLLNRMHQNKSYKTYNTHQKLYDTLYESITLDQEALNAQDAKPSFNKRSHNDQNPNDIERETKKKEGRMLGNLLLDRWFTKKSGLTVAAKRRMTCKETQRTHPERRAYYNRSGRHWIGNLKKQYKNDVELEYHVDQLKTTVFYNNDFYYLVNLSTKEKYDTSLTKHFATRYHIQCKEDMIPDRWSKKIHRYQIEAQNGIHHWEDGRQDFFKVKINNKSLDKVYSDKRIILIVRVDVKRKWGYGFLSSIVLMTSDKKEYEFSYVDLPRLGLKDIEDMYLLKVQDKLHHLHLDFKKDFNNELLLFIQRTMIQNRVGDL